MSLNAETLTEFRTTSVRLIRNFNDRLLTCGVVAATLLAGRAFMTTEQAVYKLTADIADFLRIDAGRIAPGVRADLVVIDPEHLDD